MIWNTPIHDSGPVDLVGPVSLFELIFKLAWSLPPSTPPLKFHNHLHHPRHLQSMKIRAWCPYVQLFPTNPVWGQHRLWLNQTKSNHQIISRLSILIAPLLCSFLSSPYLHPQKDGPKISFDMWISFPIVHIHIKYDILCEAQHCFMQLFSLDRCCFVRVASFIIFLPTSLSFPRLEPN